MVDKIFILLKYKFLFFLLRKIRIKIIQKAIINKFILSKIKQSYLLSDYEKRDLKALCNVNSKDFEKELNLKISKII